MAAAVQEGENVLNLPAMHAVQREDLKPGDDIYTSI